MLDGLYRVLLWLYPADFRQEYEREMLRSFRDRCRREGTLRVSMEALLDLMITAWREHLDTLGKDLRYSVRTLGRTPGFTAVAVLTLALGIGANTAIFSVVNAVLLEPLPYREPDRLVKLHERRQQGNRVRGSVSAPDFQDWRQRNTVFDFMAAVVGNDFTMASEVAPELIEGSAVSTDFFRVLGVQPRLGRDFAREEETAGKDGVVILSHSIWQNRFAADVGIIGRSITLTGRPFVIVGVLPDIPHVIRRHSEVWVPLVLSTEISRANHYLEVFARMKPSVTLEQAQTGMNIVASTLEKEFPNENTGHGVNLFPLHQEITRSVRTALLTLLGAVGLVLLVACANVANLFLARTAQRRREISIRTALGAGAGRLVRQLLTESIVLCLAGGAAGILLAYLGLQALVAASPGELPRLETVQVNGKVLFFTLAISLCTSVLFAITPALYATASGLAGALNAGRGSSDDTARGTARSALVIAEVALALLLSIGAGLMMQSFLRLTTVDPGFDGLHVLAIDLPLQGSKYERSENRQAFFSNYVSRMRSLPGVVSVGGTSALPLTGQDSGNSFQIEGQPPVPYAQQPNARVRSVMPGYFETMRIPMIAGRLISERDTEKSPRVMVVNETMARLFWPGQNAVGKRITRGEGSIEIVGVVRDVKHYQLDGEVRPEMYFPLTQYSRSFMTVVVRTALAPESLAQAARRELRDTDKDLPVADLRTVEEVLADSVSRPRLYSALLGIFSAVALLLAAVGIYGVMAYAVSQRTRELGLRMALGAPAGKVRGMILRHALVLSLAGVVVGTAGAFAVTNVIKDLLFGVSPTDPLTFFGASMLLVAVASAAAYLPALRATRVDPLVALRSE